MSPRKEHPRNEALERVAKALYGQDWIAPVSTMEWELGRRDDDLPPGLKLAQRIARARLRWHANVEQMDTVIHWLQHQHNIDCSVEGFRPAVFEKFWTDHFGGALSARDVRLAAKKSRQTAIAERWKAGERPGSKGNTTWKEFGAAVRAVCNAKCGDKTIKRDVKEMFDWPRAG
jgi:hypothetical protein